MDSAMKRFLVYGTNDRLLSVLIASTDSKFVAYLRAYWSYMCYYSVSVTDVVGCSTNFLK